MSTRRRSVWLCLFIAGVSLTVVAPASAHYPDPEGPSWWTETKAMFGIAPSECKQLQIFVLPPTEGQEVECYRFARLSNGSRYEFKCVLSASHHHEGPYKLPESYSNRYECRIVGYLVKGASIKETIRCERLSTEFSDPELNKPEDSLWREDDCRSRVLALGEPIEEYTVKVPALPKLRAKAILSPGPAAAIRCVRACRITSKFVLSRSSAKRLGVPRLAGKTRTSLAKAGTKRVAVPPTNKKIRDALTLTRKERAVSNVTGTMKLKFTVESTIVDAEGYKGTLTAKGEVRGLATHTISTGGKKGKKKRRSVDLSRVPDADTRYELDPNGEYEAVGMVKG